MPFNKEIPVGYKHAYWEHRTGQAADVAGIMVSEEFAKRHYDACLGDVRELLTVDDSMNQPFVRYTLPAGWVGVPAENPTTGMLAAAGLKNTKSSRETYKALISAAPRMPASNAKLEPDTPSSQWSAAGEPDPHDDRYNCRRIDLCMGKLGDDELANGAFLNYDVWPNPQDILAGRANSPIAWMTAVKDRIRWLSRQLEKSNRLTREQTARIEALEKENVRLIEATAINERMKIEKQADFLMAEAIRDSAR